MIWLRRSFQLSLGLFTFLLTPYQALSADLYRCTLDDYRMQNVSEEVLRSWVPDQIEIEVIKDTPILLINGERLAGQFNYNTSKKFEFSSVLKTQDSKGREIKMRYLVTHFLTNNKIRIAPAPKHFASMGDVWGQCDDRAVNNTAIETEQEAVEIPASFEKTDLTAKTYQQTGTAFHLSDYIKNGYWNSKSKRTFKKLKGKDTLQMWMGQPPCISYSWWSYPTKSATSLKKWKAAVLERMAGFPDEVIDFCTIPTDVIINGLTTDHPANSRFYVRTVGTIILRKKGEGQAERVIIEQDYLSKKTGGNLYDENLQKICEFNFKSRSAVKLRCSGYGEIDAKFEITNLFKGEFTLFGKGADFIFFGTNLSLEKAKKKHPKLFK